MGFPDLQQIDQAWQQCRRRKRGTPQAQIYELRLLDNLIDTVHALTSESWSPARPVCFTVARPKAREIHAAAFRDRVVHHWLVPRLEALYEPVFIHDVYSNRSGKGTHAAVRRLQSFMHRLQSKGNPTSPGYFLQLDIANFFVSLDRPILFTLLQKRLKKAVRQAKLSAEQARKLRWLCHRILKQNVGSEAQTLASRREICRVPPHKRLVHAPRDKGLPIGNLTSQHFANVYLNELDQFVKHTLKCRHYLRYVDDMVLLHEDRQQLADWHQEIACFLEQRLTLKLRRDALLAPITRGVDFLGYIIRPHYLLVRRRVVDNLNQKLAAFEHDYICARGSNSLGRILQLHEQQLQTLRSCLASYLGHFRHASSQRLIVSLWQRWSWLGLFLAHDQQGRLHPQWLPSSVTGYRSQVRFFRKRFPHARVVVQRGCEMDAFEPWSVHHTIDDRLPTLQREIRQINVVEAGYLKGGLKHRVIHSYYFEPGVRLCRNSL